MRKIYLLFSILLAFIQFDCDAQTKKALIVAIANFDDIGWPSLGSMNDYEILNTTFQKQGFEKQNITLLSGDKTSKADVVAGINKFTASLNSGDVVIVEFSTHGVQVQDMSGDEVDGLDEAIVCKNSPRKIDDSNIKNIKQDFLLDDEMGEIVNDMRLKIGSKGDLLFLMDFCHSGSSTRGGQDLVARGGKAPIVSASFKPTGKADEDLNSLEMQASRGMADLAPYTIISAARSHQLDYERLFNNKSVGALTYGVVNSLESKITKEYTYRTFFTDIQTAILEKGQQNPVIETSSDDKIILGGAVIPQQEYFEISNVLEGDKKYELIGGTLNDLNRGAEVVFCLKGTNKPDSKNILAKGEVVSSDPFKSIVVLSDSKNKIDNKNSWVFISNKKLVFENVSINFISNKARGSNSDQLFTNSELKQLKSRLDKIGYLTVTEQPDLLIAKNKDRYDLFFNSGLELFANCGTDDLETAISNYSKYCTMKKLELGNPYAKVEIKIYESADKEVERVNGNYLLKNGIEYSLKITSKSPKDLHINLVYLDKSGEIMTVFPGAEDQQDDCIVSKDKPIKTKLTISPPFGMETLKLVVSDATLDMRKLNTNNNFSRGGDASLNDLESLFGKINNPQTRGIAITNASDVMMLVGNFIFETQP